MKSESLTDYFAVLRQQYHVTEVAIISDNSRAIGKKQPQRAESMPSMFLRPNRWDSSGRLSVAPKSENHLATPTRPRELGSVYKRRQSEPTINKKNELRGQTPRNAKWDPSHQNNDLYQPRRSRSSAQRAIPNLPINLSTMPEHRMRKNIPNMLHEIRSICEEFADMVQEIQSASS